MKYCFYFRIVLLQLFAVSFNYFLVPVEGILSFSVEVAVTIVVSVDIDEAVAFFHFTGSSRNQIDAAPHRITHQINTIFNCFLHRFNVFFQIFDPVVVVEFPICTSFIIGA